MLLAMGAAVFLESLALLVFGEKQRGVPTVMTGVVPIFDARLPKSRILVVFVAAALIASLVVFVQYTRTGRALRAMAQDREAAALQGVNVRRLSAFGFGLGAGLAGLAGGLRLHLRGLFRRRHRDLDQVLHHDHDRRRRRHLGRDPRRLRARLHGIDWRMRFCPAR